MKILHFSDTHLGFNDLDAVSDENINQREADFYDIFKQVVHHIEKSRPDFVIHTGDLFHRATPSNRAITFAIEQLKRIETLGIPFILIAGNHSTPRTALSAPILKIFDHFSNVYAAYREKYEAFIFDEVVFHAVPHINDDEKKLIEIETCEKHLDEKRKNILLLHCSVGESFLMHEYGEWVYPKEKESLFTEMDYVGLGHWHGFKNLKKHPNVYYSGSTERTGGDRRNEKGFIDIDLDQTLEVSFVPLLLRPFLSFSIECERFEESIEEVREKEEEGSVVEVTLENLSMSFSMEITTKEMQSLFPSAMHVSVKRKFSQKEGENVIKEVEALSLEAFFLDHLKEESSEAEFGRLESKVKALFATYEEIRDDS